MASFYSRTGDDGYTGLLGDERVPKYDLRLEVLGTLDEATAVLGLARANAHQPVTGELLMRVQRDLYHLMAEVAATAENAERFRTIDASYVRWVEEQTDLMGKQVELPRAFILPGDTMAGAALDLARTVIRRAERRLAELFHVGGLENPDLLRYLNRLSSLVFILELYENRASGASTPSLAKGQKEEPRP